MYSLAAIKITSVRAAEILHPFSNLEISKVIGAGPAPWRCAAFGSCLVANPDRETWSDISEISPMSNPFPLSRYQLLLALSLPLREHLSLSLSLSFPPLYPAQKGQESGGGHQRSITTSPMFLPSAFRNGNRTNIHGFENGIFLSNAPATLKEFLRGTHVYLRISRENTRLTFLSQRDLLCPELLGGNYSTYVRYLEKYFLEVH